MEQAKISKNCKNQNYLNEIATKDQIREVMCYDFKMKRSWLDKKMSKRLVGKVKNVDDAEKNAMVWKKFLVKFFFILKMFENWTSNQKYNEKKYGG